MAEAINIPEEDLSRYEAEEEISTHLLAELFRKFMMPGIFSSLNANSKITEYGHAPSEDDPDTAFSNADLIDYMTRTELGNQLREKNAQSHLYEIPLLSSAAFAHARTTADGTLTGFWVAADYDETITLSIDTGATFCLRAPDDAMAAAGIRTDDLVFVKKQLIMDDGEIAVVLVPRACSCAAFTTRPAPRSCSSQPTTAASRRSSSISSKMAAPRSSAKSPTPSRSPTERASLEKIAV